MNEDCKGYELKDEDVETVSGGADTITACPFGRASFSYNTLCNACENRKYNNGTFVCQLNVPGQYTI